MKRKLLALTLLASFALTACGSGNVSPGPAPAPGNDDVTPEMETFLAQVGKDAAADIGLFGSYFLDWDLIDAKSYPLEYAKIPEGWYIAGLNWSNIALINTEVWPDKFGVAETVWHELTHVKQREEGCQLNRVTTPYDQRWYEVEAKCEGFRGAIRWANTNGVAYTDYAVTSENYWCARQAEFPRILSDCTPTDYGFEANVAQKAGRPLIEVEVKREPG